MSCDPSRIRLVEDTVATELTRGIRDRLGIVDLPHPVLDKGGHIQGLRSSLAGRVHGRLQVRAGVHEARDVDRQAHEG